MNKLFICSMLTLGLVSLASCSNEDAPVAAGPDGVTFSLRLPGDMGSRGTFGDGDAAGDRAVLDNLQWTVYEVTAGGPQMVFSEGRDAFAASQVQESVTIALAKGKTYQVVFYADDKDNTFATYADGKVSVDYDKAASNTAGEDAFIGKSSQFTVSGAHVETVTLTRPFAQLNWGTDDKAAAAIAPLINSETAPLSAAVSVTAGLFGSMDVLTGEVSDPVSESVQFAAVLLKDAPAQTFPVQKDDATAVPYALVAMNYLLTGEGTIDCSLNFNNGLSPVEVSSAPVKVNYRTNIFGSLLTDPGIFNIKVDNSFLGDLKHEVKPETPEQLVAAIANPAVTDIEIDKDFDLSEQAPEALTFNTPKTITIAEGKTLSVGDNSLTANMGLTIIGGKLNNVTAAAGSGASKVKARANAASDTKALIVVNGGDLLLDGVELLNDTTWHMHGAQLNCAAVTYFGTTNVTIRKSRILSGGYTVCGWRNATGTVLIEDSYLESNSSNKYGHWAYATRLTGTKTTVKNCEVKGIQGALSIEGEANQAVIDGGKYYTVNTPGRMDAFYAVYATAGAKVTILGGEFSGANNWSGGVLNEPGETSCLTSGDNDAGMTVGAFVIRGGKFSGRAYNHNTKNIYQPESPLSYQPSTDPNFKWEVK